MPRRPSTTCGCGSTAARRTSSSSMRGRPPGRSIACFVVASDAARLRPPRQPRPDRVHRRHREPDAARGAGRGARPGRSPRCGWQPRAGDALGPRPRRVRSSAGRRAGARVRPVQGRQRRVRRRAPARRTPTSPASRSTTRPARRSRSTAGACRTGRRASTASTSSAFGADRDRFDRMLRADVRPERRRAPRSSGGLLATGQRRVLLRAVAHLLASWLAAVAARRAPRRPRHDDPLDQSDAEVQRERHDRGQQDRARRRGPSGSCSATASSRCRARSSRPTYSPKIAPMTAYTTLIRRPVNSDGSADGQRSTRKVCRVEAPSERMQGRRVRIDPAEPVEQRDRHREERDQDDDHDLGQQPEPEPDDEQRRDGHDRDRLAGHEQRLDRPADGRPAIERDGGRRSPRTTETAHPTSASTRVGTRWPIAASRKSHSAPTHAGRRRQA